MQTTIQFIKMQTSESLEVLVIKKLKKLGKKNDNIIRAEIVFKLENDSKNKGNVCEIQLSLLGPRVFASSIEASFEGAIDKTIKDLARQLKRRKQKIKPYS